MPWLENLKVGDEVFLPPHVQKIDGETPSFWRIGTNLAGKRDGKIRGTYGTFLSEPTLKLRRASETLIARQKCYSMIRRLSEKSLPPMSLENVYVLGDLLDQALKIIESK